MTKYTYNKAGLVSKVERVLSGETLSSVSVAHDRRAERGGVYAYLVHPPGVDAELDKRDPAALREDRPVRHGRKPVAADRRVDRAALLLRRAVHHGKIRLADGLVGLELAAQGQIYLAVQGKHHHAARLAVESIASRR